MDENSKTDKEILLEQYKLYVEMADRISQRRQSANNYFISVNIFLFSFLSYLKYIKSDMGTFIIFSAGIVVCFVWHRLIKSYKGINGGKFKVIHEMETNLSCQPYKAEWEIVGRGKDKKLYHPFTQIELYVPYIFIVLYALFILYLCILKFFY